MWVIKVENEDNMLEVEKRLSEMARGENGRCSWLHSVEYQKFRLKCLYGIDNGIDRIVRDNVSLQWQDGGYVHIYYQYNENFEEEDKKRKSYTG